MIEIKHKKTGEVLKRVKADTLEGAKLVGADLTGADLTGQNLKGADFRRANIKDAEFKNADLEDADLTGVVNALPIQFGGANLKRCKPADFVKFDGITQVDEGLKNAGKLYLTLLSLCAFAVLVVLSTKDVQLVTNTGEADLPLVNVKIPIPWFFILAPALIILTFVTMHLHLLRAWEGMAKLPSVFPDGLSIDRKVHPLFLNSIMLSHMPRWQEISWLHFHRLQWFAGVLTAYLVPAAALILIWGRYLVKQQPTVSCAHILGFEIVCGMGIVFHNSTLLTVRWSARHLMFHQVALWGSICTMLLIQYLAFTDFAEARWLGFKLNSIGIRGYADLTEQDISTDKPSDWKTMDALMSEAQASLTKPGKEGPAEQVVVMEALRRMDLQIQKVKPARLAGESLRGARAASTFLAKADLRGVDFYRADLTGADLSQAKLESARLSKATLIGASLLGCDLLKIPDLREADLRGADLRGAHLHRAQLSGANLNGADLSGADLGEADLNRAHLNGVHLNGAYLNRAALSGADLVRAQLGEADLSRAQLSESDLSAAYLYGTYLYEADLRGADLYRANLIGADLSGADLRGVRNIRAALSLAKYTKGDKFVQDTLWPKDFDPTKEGLIQVNFEPTKEGLIQVNIEGKVVKPPPGRGPTKNKTTSAASRHR